MSQTQEKAPGNESKGLINLALNSLAETADVQPPQCDCISPDDWLCPSCRALALPQLRAEIRKNLVTTISFIDVKAARERDAR